MVKPEKNLGKREQVKRNQLVKASLQLFLGRGFHECRIEDIASKASVGKGTFYLYFKNKEDLVDQLLENFMDEVRSTLNWVDSNVDDNSNLEDIFKEEGRLLVATMEKNRKFAHFFFREGRSVSQGMNKKIISFTREIIELSENTFAAAMAAGLIPIQNPRVCAVSVFGSINHLYEFWLDGGFKGEETSVSEITEHCVEFFVRALGVKDVRI